MRRHWLDALSPELVQALGDAMTRVRDDNGTSQQQRAEVARVCGD